MKYTLLFTALFLSIQGLLAQNNLQLAINRLASDPVLKHAGFSVCILNLENGQMVAGHEVQRSLIPASSLKLVTAATAYALLSSNFRYTTDLQIQGNIDQEGVLQGNVIIKGSGDPSLGSPEWNQALDLEALLEKFKTALQQNGIQKVNGFIIGDDSYFSTAATPRTWTYNDMGNYYGSGVYGLNLHDNLYYLQFKQVGQLGAQPPIYAVNPSIPDLQLVNELRSAGRNTGDNAYIFGMPYTSLRYIRGSIPIGSRLFKIKGSIPDPPLFAAQQLQTALKKSGIEVSKGANTTRIMKIRQQEDKRPVRTLIRHHSPSLNKLVERTLYRSVNLYAEALVHKLGKVNKDKGDTQSGIQVINEYWKTQNVNMGGAFIVDGSGLSPKNAISTRALASILQRFSKHQDFEEFKATIPLAGKTGNLSRKFKGTPAEGKVWAKSGTLSRVRAYSGYATSTNGKKYSFAIIINNYSGRGSSIRQKLDQFLIDLCR